MKAPLDSLILTIRDTRVILDSDLAEIYGVPTKRLNEQVKRNSGRFPADFTFRLSAAEWKFLRSQIVTSNPEPSQDDEDMPNRSQNATGSQRHRNPRLCPYAFTEHGALMAANVLNSPEAVKMSVYVIRAFIKQRELLMAQSDVLKKLAAMDAKLLRHDDALRIIWQELQPLLTPPPGPPRPQIGFHVKEAPPAYGKKPHSNRNR